MKFFDIDVSDLHDSEQYSFLHFLHISVAMMRFLIIRKEVRPPLKSALAATYLNVSLSIISITGATTAR